MSKLFPESVWRDGLHCVSSVSRYNNHTAGTPYGKADYTTWFRTYPKDGESYESFRKRCVKQYIEFFDSLFNT